MEGARHAQRRVEVLITQGEEHLAVDGVRLEGLSVHRQLDALEPRRHVARLPRRRRRARGAAATAATTGETAAGAAAAGVSTATATAASGSAAAGSAGACAALCSAISRASERSADCHLSAKRYVVKIMAYIFWLCGSEMANGPGGASSATVHIMRRAPSRAVERRPESERLARRSIAWTDEQSSRARG